MKSLNKSWFNFNTPSGFFGATFLAMASILSFMTIFFLNSAISWFVSMGQEGTQTFEVNNAINFLLYTGVAGTFATILLIVGTILLLFSYIESNRTPPADAPRTGLLGGAIIAWLLCFLFVVNPILFVNALIGTIVGPEITIFVQIVVISVLGLFFVIVPGFVLLGSAYYSFVRK